MKFSDRQISLRPHQNFSKFLEKWQGWAPNIYPFIQLESNSPFKPKSAFGLLKQECLCSALGVRNPQNWMNRKSKAAHAELRTTPLLRHTMLKPETSDLRAYLESFREITLSKGSRATTRICPSTLGPRRKYFTSTNKMQPLTPVIWKLLGSWRSRGI